jgi:glycosyltransferase involved in cell wall biosynthesis
MHEGPGPVMAASAVQRLVVSLPACAGKAPSILVGVTSAQSCLALKGRLRALREAGFGVTLVASPGHLLNQAAAEEGLETIAIPMRREVAPLPDLVSFLRLWRLLGKCKPDMVEFSTPKAGLLGSLAAWLRGVPCRVYMLRGLRLETSKGLKRRILLAAEKMASACAHVVLCNSDSLRAEALALGIAPREKLHLLGDGSSNGVNIERFSPGPTNVREQMGISRAAPVIGFVGRLTRDKGVPELAEAFDAILHAEPEAHLLLVGWFDNSGDALGAEIRVRIESHPRIHLTGFVSDPAPYYRAMDLMVLPTWREGFPNVVLEAAASGVPVVTTLSTGARDSVVPEATGLLVAPGSVEAIYEATLKLLRDPERRLQMGNAARIWVVEHYLDERVLGLTSAFYKGMVPSHIAANRVSVY